MTRYLLIVIVAIVTTACASAPRTDPQGPPSTFSPRMPDPKNLVIVPDERIQAELVAMTPFVWSDPVEFHRRAHPLLESVRRQADARRRLQRLQHRPFHLGDRTELGGLIEQVAYFAAHPRVLNDSVRVFRQFMYFDEISAISIVGALAPYVDSPDDLLANFVRTEVLYTDYDSDLMGLILYGQTHKEDFSPTLVEIMYRQNPDGALVNLISFFFSDHVKLGNSTLGDQAAFTRHAVQEVLFWDSWHQLQPKMLNDADDQLKMLLKSDAWWVRRYVAEVLWKYRVFRRVDLVLLLNTDPDSRVSEAFKRTKGQEDELEDTTGW